MIKLRVSFCIVLAAWIWELCSSHQKHYVQNTEGTEHCLYRVNITSTSWVPWLSVVIETYRIYHKPPSFAKSYICFWIDTTINVQRWIVKRKVLGVKKIQLNSLHSWDCPSPLGRFYVCTYICVYIHTPPSPPRYQWLSLCILQPHTWQFIRSILVSPFVSQFAPIPTISAPSNVNKIFRKHRNL